MRRFEVDCVSKICLCGAGSGWRWNWPGTACRAKCAIFKNLPKKSIYHDISYSDSIADGGDGPNRTGRGHAH
jgi:hypothetical protein